MIKQKYVFNRIKHVYVTMSDQVTMGSFHTIAFHILSKSINIDQGILMLNIIPHN